MKLFLSHAPVKSADKFERWIETSISSLLPLLKIEEAHVSIEYNRESSPCYHAKAHLKVPGPDLRAQGIDHTPGTAFVRVIDQLRARAVERAVRRLRRRGEKRVLPAYLPASSSHA
jgi:ribosome-associated translation inhibitor RaiA